MNSEEKESRPAMQLYRRGYRSQIVHPITKKRLSLVGRTVEEVERQKAAIRAAALDARLHAIPEKEAIVKIESYAAGRPLRVADVWDAHVRSLSGDWRPQAESTWRCRLAPWFDDLAAAELTEDKFREWEAEQKNQLIGARTIRNAYDLLAAAFRKQVKRGRLRELPWGDYKPRKPRAEENEREACRSTNELLALLHAARRRDERTAGWPNVDAPYITRVALIALLGARQGEAAAWAWDDLEQDPSGKWVLVVKRQAKRRWKLKYPHLDRPPHLPKGGKPRRTAVHQTAEEILSLHREHLKRIGKYRPDGPIFPASDGSFRPNGRLLEPHILREMWKDAGLPNPERAVTHSLRHTLGTLEAIAGLDVKSVAARLGHSDIKTSLGYMHRTDRGLAQSAIPPLTLFDGAPRALSQGGAMVFSAVPLEGMQLPGLGDEAAQQRQGELDETARLNREQERARFMSDRRELSFDEAAAQWERENFDSVRPRSVTDAMENARAKHYLRTLRHALDKGSPLEKARDAAKVAGFRGKMAVLACWLKYARAKGLPVKEKPKAKKKGGAHAA